MPERTPITAQGFALMLDGSKTAGYLKSFSGGSVSADVIEEAPGSDGFAKKHIGAPRYQEFTVQVDMSMTNDLYDWINSSLVSKPLRKNGAIVAHDFNYEARSRREFFSALISEVNFPAADASSKDASFLTVKFRARVHTLYESVRETRGDAEQDSETIAGFQLQVDDRRSRLHAGREDRRVHDQAGDY